MMDFLVESWQDLSAWTPALLAVLDIFLIVATFTWILMTKNDSTSAVAWCLIVVFLPFVGAILFVLFGYQHVHRPLKRKRRHKAHYHRSMSHAAQPILLPLHRDDETNNSLHHNLEHLADRVGAYPLTFGNHVEFFFDGNPAFEAMLAAIRGAKHHVHLEYFIVQADELGQAVLAALTEKAQAGVEVRLVYDAMGTRHLTERLLAPLHRAGGKTSPFLPLNLLRRRIQVNMRNHRKILVVDGTVAFTGGLNIGDEYLGKVARFGFWRDTHLRIRGPAVTHLQRVFCEDWDFAFGERLIDPGSGQVGASYFYSESDKQGDIPIQVIDSGPDQDLRGIREMYFAAIIQARKRVWIASPYFVPDGGILDAMCLAARLGVDVRFLGQFQPDKWIPQYAARYYWSEVLPAGVQVYQYTRGMMHSKVIIIDDDWATVGTANLDNRSLFLNFEVNCLFYSPDVVARLAQAFEEDLEHSIQLEPSVFAHRPFAARLLENAARLLSPVL